MGQKRVPCLVCGVCGLLLAGVLVGAPGGEQRDAEALCRAAIEKMVGTPHLVHFETLLESEACTTSVKGLSGEDPFRRPVPPVRTGERGSEADGRGSIGAFYWSV